MINKKISTVAGIIIILAIIGAISISFLISSKQKEEVQNNVVLNNSGLENKEVIKQNNEEKLIEENKDLKISDKWTVVNHENYWNNPNIFAHKNYNFPSIEFSYPENWEFKCCGDMGHASEHFINPPENSLSYIRITNYVLGGCPDFKKICALDENAKLTANEKFNRLKSNITSDKVLPEKEIKKLNIKAFAFKKTEKEGNSSMAYLINLKDDVIQIDFVNYELLDENFINSFLDHISPGSK